jgi:hypothetical protein
MKLLKPRATALVVLGAWFILVIWVGYMYLTQPAVRPMPSRSAGAAIPQALQIDISTASQILQALEFLRKLDAEALNLTDLTRDLLPIIAFTPEQRATIEAAQGGRRVVEHQPVISMILMNGDQRGALVDGSYVREGDELKNGAIIEKIHENGITLRDGVGLSRLLTLQNAFIDKDKDDASRL